MSIAAKFNPGLEIGTEIHALAFADRIGKPVSPVSPSHSIESTSSKSLYRRAISTNEPLAFNERPEGSYPMSLKLRQVLTMLMILGVLPASARDNGQWGSSPAYLRQWFQSLMQPDNPVQSCCGEGDAFEADNWEFEEDGTFVAIITDGKGLVPNGTRVVVPDRKLKWDAGNPTGHGIIFLTSSFQAICYVTPGGV